MKRLLFAVLLILVLVTGCSTNDTVTITADRNSYTPLMSSAQGITLTPDFEAKTNYKNLVYHWETSEGEFVGMGKEVNNQGEDVIWSAVADGKVAEIKNDFDIILEVIEGESKNVLATAKITITSTDNGFYSIKACSSSKVPTDEEIKIAYQQAVEAYSWFDLTTMPVNPNSEIEYNGRFYEKVNHNNIHSFADLETYLHSHFSDNIVDSLLKDNRYVDIDGALYAITADRGSNIFAGEEYHEIIQESDKKINYKVSVDILDENLEKL